ncbi:hypothetical protein VKT23_008290 [Stygiomarasmius scandens]|uniref:Uncharacterized protein n=1 Tax=Marasmiellus scandens TaxID=2682957 RepID=A0ABR1JK13_9AGAR
MSSTQAFNEADNVSFSGATSLDIVGGDRVEVHYHYLIQLPAEGLRSPDSEPQQGPGYFIFETIFNVWESVPTYLTVYTHTELSTPLLPIKSDHNSMAPSSVPSDCARLARPFSQATSADLQTAATDHQLTASPQSTARIPALSMLTPQPVHQEDVLASPSSL